MRSWIALTGIDEAPDVRLIGSLAAPLRTATSTSPEILTTSAAAFASVSHLPGDRPPRIVREGSFVVIGDLRIDDRDAIAGSLGVDRSMQDIELFAHAWSRWGHDAPSHILGDFSLVVWDEDSRTLTCVRDRFGVRPLYLARAGNGFIASDVLEAIIAHPAVDATTLDDRAVSDYLRNAVQLDATATIFAAVRRVPPASMTIVRHVSSTTHRYWCPALNEPVRQPVEALEAALQRAVADRTRGGPAVVFMSGGLDSTGLAAIAREQSAASVTAVTSVWRGSSGDEEEPFAIEAASSIGIPIEIFALDRYDPLGAVASGLWSADPGPLLYAPSTRDVYALAARFAPVALHGHPADALLSGEPLHMLRRLVDQRRFAAVLRTLILYTRAKRRLPWFFAKDLLGMKRAEPGSRPAPPWFADALMRQAETAQADTRESSSGSADARSPQLQAIASPIWANYFEWASPVATGAPIELVYPFTDPRVVDAALGLEEIPWRVEKYVLRQVLRGRVSERIRKGRKRLVRNDSWTTPAARLEDLPLRETAGYIDPDRFAATVRAEGRLHDQTLRALIFEYWLRELPRRTAALQGRA